MVLCSFYVVLSVPAVVIFTTIYTPVTSYTQIWLNNLDTIFGNAMQTNVQRKFEHKFGNVKIAHFGFLRSPPPLFLERKRMLKLEINKNEVERGRLVEEANFPVFLCTAKFDFTKGPIT